MKTVVIALLTLVVAGHAYGQTGSIHGHITELNGKPLAGAAISIHRLGIQQHFETTSDARGNYNHVGLPTGRYEVSITHEGKTAKLNAVVRFGGDSALDFDLRVLLPYDPEQRHRVTAASLRVPKKALDQWQKAFDSKDNLEKAKAHLEKAIEIAPDFLEALNDLGTIYYRRKQFAEAAALFERALTVDPDFVTARVNLGGALLSLQQFARALDENIRVLAVRPHDPLAHAQTALCLLYLDRLEEALQHLQQAKQSDPGSTLVIEVEAVLDARVKRLKSTQSPIQDERDR